MTTIAYKDDIMVSDSRSCIGDLIYEEDCQKLFTNQGPFLVIGIAGNYQDGMDILDIIKGYTQIDQVRNIDFKEAKIQASFLGVTYDGKLWHYAGDCSFQLRNDLTFAVGSGSDFALGAMASGKTAEEAVIIASRFDVSTNSEIQVVDLRATEEEPKEEA